MKKLQLLLFILALLCLAGWMGLRKPYSPSDNLPPVSYQAFDLAGTKEQDGATLAAEARQWPGVTASTFNPGSGLLVLSHTKAQSTQVLLTKIQAISKVPVKLKVFEKPEGPVCPVPMGLILAFPTYLFWTGVFFSTSLILWMGLLPFYRRFHFG